jgi:hypothetical protein
MLGADAQLRDGDDERQREPDRADCPARAICQRDADTVTDEDRPQAHGEMADHEQDRQRIMWNEPNVPRIEQ